MKEGLIYSGVLITAGILAYLIHPSVGTSVIILFMVFTLSR